MSSDRVLVQYNIKENKMIFDDDPFIIIRAERSPQSKDSQCIYVRNQAPKKIWSPLENHQYIRFFEENPQYWECSTKRRKQIKFFSLMHAYIPTRTANQIKSHYQKLMERYSKIDIIVSEMKKQMKEQLERVEIAPFQENDNGLHDYNFQREKVQLNINISEDALFYSDLSSENFFQYLKITERQPSSPSPIFYDDRY